jgi:hypothetical protein
VIEILKTALQIYLIAVGLAIVAGIVVGSILLGQMAFDYHFLAGCSFIGAEVLVGGLLLAIIDAKLSGKY